MPSGKKKSVTFRADVVDGRARKRNKRAPREFKSAEEAIASKARKARMCKKLKTSASLEEYWLRLRKKYVASFRRNIMDGQQTTDARKLKKIAKHRKLLRSQLGRAERMIETCAIKNKLVNPVFKYPLLMG